MIMRIKFYAITMIMMIKFYAAVEENTECQKLSIVEFKPKIFTTENEIQQTLFQSTYS